MAIRTAITQYQIPQMIAPRPNTPLAQQIAGILGVTPRTINPLRGGDVGEVYRLELPDGLALVAKVDRSATPMLRREANMLRYLAEHTDLPVPSVVHGSDRLLLLELIPGSSHFSASAQEHAAELLVSLHSITAPTFGLEEDTLIGGLHQPNPRTASWLDFFRDQRLLYMGREATRAGRLPSRTFARLEVLATKLDQWLTEPDQPSLIHGDIWTTNVLAQGGRITGFLDPAIYFADPEIELAFITLFNTFGRSFFQRYHELRPIPPNFWKIRRDLYNLYPLLVHVRLFGGGYVKSVEQTLKQLGV